VGKFEIFDLTLLVYLPHLPLNVANEISLIAEILLKSTLQVHILGLCDLLNVERDLNSFKLALVKCFELTSLLRNLLVDMYRTSKVGLRTRLRCIISSDSVLLTLILRSNVLKVN